MLYDARIPGNETCAPSGLTLLKSWADAAALGDVVVVALGTNDAGLYDKSRLQSNWAEALRLAGGRPVVFLTTQARVGSDQYARQGSYSSALRQWCSGQRLCVVARVGEHRGSQRLGVVRRRGAHQPRRHPGPRAFIADVVAALLTGRPIPNPQPPPTPAIPPAVTTTTTTAVADGPNDAPTTAVATDPTATTTAPTTTIAQPDGSRDDYDPRTARRPWPRRPTQVTDAQCPARPCHAGLLRGGGRADDWEHFEVCEVSPVREPLVNRLGSSVSIS